MRHWTDLCSFEHYLVANVLQMFYFTELLSSTRVQHAKTFAKRSANVSQHICKCFSVKHLQNICKTFLEVVTVLDASHGKEKPTCGT